MAADDLTPVSGSQQLRGRDTSLSLGAKSGHISRSPVAVEMDTSLLACLRRAKGLAHNPNLVKPPCGARYRCYRQGAP